MKRFNLLLRFALPMGIAMLIMLPAPPASGAVTILQAGGSGAMAWEAENYGAYVNDPLGVTVPSPTEVWAPTNDVTASGGQVLYTQGANVTAFPVSYVEYQLQFSTPGAYSSIAGPRPTWSLLRRIGSRPTVFGSR